jgi:hypothetical protein
MHLYTVISMYFGGVAVMGRDRDRIVVDLQLLVQSVPITTKVVSSNPTQERCT